MIKTCDECGKLDSEDEPIIRLEGVWNCESCHLDRLRKTGRSVFYTENENYKLPEEFQVNTNEN